MPAGELVMNLFKEKMLCHAFLSHALHDLHVLSTIKATQNSIQVFLHITIPVN